MFTLAYIGPGAGLSLVGALVGLIGSIVVSLLMLVAYPLRKMFKKRSAVAAAAGHVAASTPPSTSV